MLQSYIILLFFASKKDNKKKDSPWTILSCFFKYNNYL